MTREPLPTWALPYIQAIIINAASDRIFAADNPDLYRDPIVSSTSSVASQFAAAMVRGGDENGKAILEAVQYSNAMTESKICKEDFRHVHLNGGCSK